MQPHQSFSSPGRYLGSGAPSPVLMGGSPYGSSLFNGSSMPPYDVPFSGGSPYHFNYNSLFPPAGPHYRPFHMSGPPSPYHGRSMMGSGMYGMPPPPMDRYGFGMAMSPAAAAAMVCIKKFRWMVLMTCKISGMELLTMCVFFVDAKTRRVLCRWKITKERYLLVSGYAFSHFYIFYCDSQTWLCSFTDSSRENDWACPNCGNVNFSFRTMCNMRKCNTPKPVPQVCAAPFFWLYHF